MIKPATHICVLEHLKWRDENTQDCLDLVVTFNQLMANYINLYQYDELCKMGIKHATYNKQ